MFHNILGVGYPQSPFANTPQSYKKLSDLMSRYWVNFIVDGDPNGAGGKFFFFISSRGNPQLPLSSLYICLLTLMKLPITLLGPRILSRVPS